MDSTTPAFKVDGLEPPMPVEVPHQLELFDDRHASSATEFPKEPHIRLRGIRSVLLNSVIANTQNLELSFTIESARAAKFTTLQPDESISFATVDSRETFDLNVWMRNGTDSTTQELYVVGMKPKTKAVTVI